MLIKGGNSIEVPCSDGEKVVLEVVEAHIVNEPNENSDIGLQGFGCNLVDEYKGEER